MAEENNEETQVQDSTTVEQVDVNIDEMFGQPGAESILLPAEEVEPEPEQKKSNLFSKGADTTVTITPANPFTFTTLGPAGTVITQSGLFDSAAGGNMFSARDIPGQGGTGLGVTRADTLSVTWTITLE